MILKKKFLEILRSVDDFNPELLRIGTKSSIYYHKKGTGFDQLRDIFRQKIFPTVETIESVFGGKEIDIGMPMYFKEGSSYFNVMTGPMKRNQLLRETSFDENPNVYRSIPDSGLFLSIDLFQKEEDGDLSYDDLDHRINENIVKIERKFNSFKDWLLLSE